jgi:hypothetical protein
MLKKYKDPIDDAKYQFKDEYKIQQLSNMYMTSGINFDIGLKEMSAIYGCLQPLLLSSWCWHA